MQLSERQSMLLSLLISDAKGVSVAHALIPAPAANGADELGLERSLPPVVCQLKPGAGAQETAAHRGRCASPAAMPRRPGYCLKPLPGYSPLQFRL